MSRSGSTRSSSDTVSIEARSDRATTSGAKSRNSPAAWPSRSRAASASTASDPPRRRRVTRRVPEATRTEWRSVLECRCDAGQELQIRLEVGPQLRRCAGCRRYARLHERCGIAEHRIHDLREQLVLAVEVIRDDALARPDPGRDRRQRRTAMTDLGEQLDRRSENLLTPSRSVNESSSLTAWSDHIPRGQTQFAPRDFGRRLGLDEV